MGGALLLALACALAATLVPVSVRVVVGWDEEKRIPLSLSLFLWRVDLFRLGRRWRRSGGSRSSRAESEARSADPLARIPPWVRNLIRTLSRTLWKRTVRNWKERRSGVRRKDRLLPLLLLLVRAFVISPTRRVRLELGGVDPATLGAMHGAFLSVEPLLPGNSTFAFHPRWGLVQVRGRLLWQLRFSLAGLLGGILFPTRRPPRPLLPSLG